MGNWIGPSNSQEHAAEQLSYACFSHECPSVPGRQADSLHKLFVHQRWIYFTGWKAVQPPTTRPPPAFLDLFSLQWEIINNSVDVWRLTLMILPLLHLLSLSWFDVDFLLHPMFGKLDLPDSSILLLPTYKQKLKQTAPTVKTICWWSEESDSAF